MANFPDSSPLRLSDVADIVKDIRRLAESFSESQAILGRIAERVDGLGADVPARATSAPPAGEWRANPPAEAARPPAPMTPSAHVPPPVTPQVRPPQVRPPQFGPRDVHTAPSRRFDQPPYPTAQPRFAAPKPDPWWTKEGAITRVLGIAGGVLTAIGMAFFLAIVFNLVGPFGQLAIAILVGGVLGGTGWALQRRHSSRRGPSAPRTHIGALALLGTAVAVFMLIPVAASSVYELIPAAVGLALVIVVAAAGVSLARTLSSAVMAGIGSCGAMVSMMIVERSPLTLAAVAVMFIVSGLLTTRLGIALRFARTLTYFGAAVAIYGQTWFQGDEGTIFGLDLVPASYLAILTAVAVSAMAIGVRDIEKGGADAVTTGMCAFAPMLLVVFYIFDLDINPNPFFLLLIAAFFLPTGIAIQLRATRFRAPTVGYARATMSAGAVALNLGLLWMAQELEWPAAIACLTLTISATSAFVWHLSLRTQHSLTQACLVGVIPLAWTVPEIVDHRLWFLPELPFEAPAITLAQLAAASAFAVFAAYVLSKTLPGLLSGRPATSTAQWAWSLLTIAWIASTILYAGLYLTSVSDSEMYFYLGHLIVTVLCFGLAIGLLSTKKPLPKAKAFGAIVFIASLAKLFLVDLGTMSALVRILVFCLVGAMLLAAATLLSGRADSPPSPPAGEPLNRQGAGQNTQPGPSYGPGAQGPGAYGTSTQGPAAYGAGPHGTNPHGPAAGGPRTQGPGR